MSPRRLAGRLLLSVGAAAMTTTACSGSAGVLGGNTTGDPGGLCGESGEIVQLFVSDSDGMKEAISRARTRLSDIDDPKASAEVFDAALGLVLVARSLELRDGLPADDESLIAFIDASRALERACGH